MVEKIESFLKFENIFYKNEGEMQTRVLFIGATGCGICKNLQKRLPGMIRKIIFISKSVRMRVGYVHFTILCTG